MTVWRGQERDRWATTTSAVRAAVAAVAEREPA